MAHYLRTPSVERLPTLLEELYTGALRIPPFQREFEWTGRQRTDLCDSIRRGLPTGALMVWRTTKNLAAEDPIGPYRLGPSKAETSQFLLDGRQRMTTLYAALAAGLWTRDGKKVTPLDPYAPDNTPWAISYDLEKSEFVLDWPSEDSDDTSLTAEISTQGRRFLLPLAVILDDSAYDEWRVKAQLTRELANQARAVRSAFIDYLIPVLPLATDEIEVVTTTFKRVNSGGTTMGDTDMARVLVWSEGFDLREETDTVREGLKPLGWNEIDDDVLLTVVAAVAEMDPTEIDLEKLAKQIKAHPSLVRRAGDHVTAAVRLLGRLGIAGPGALPYTQILVFVARAVHSAGGALNSDQERQVEGWVAEACLDERFRAGPPHMIRAYWRALANRVGLPGANASAQGDSQRKVRECSRFSMAWARSRGTALVLADQHPRDASDQPFASPAALVARGTANVGMLIAEGGAGLEGIKGDRASRALPIWR